MPPTRRTFVIGGVSLTLGAGLYAFLRDRGYEVDPSVRPEGEVRGAVSALPGPAFDPRARAALPLLVAELLPGDPALGLPSGPDAGVVEFIEAACRLPGLLSVRNDVLKLIRHLDVLAQRARGVRLVELGDPALVAQVVRDAADEAIPKGRFVPAQAMEVCLRLALEGYLGHPAHGGNRDFAVWTALDIAMPRERAPHLG